MKKIFILLFLWLVLTSCTGQNSSTQKTNLDINNKEQNMTKKEIAQTWDKVAVSYTGTFEDGVIFDATSKHGWTPLEFTVWAGQMIPWFDKAVEWMKIWETKKVTLAPSEAYGEKDPNRKQVIPLTEQDKKSLELAWYELKVWAKLPTMMWELPILEISWDDVTVDANHPLAWKTLIFEIKLEEIK